MGARRPNQLAFAVSRIHFGLRYRFLVFGFFKWSGGPVDHRFFHF